MKKFKVGDTIKITAGKDKNQTGKIIKVLPRKEQVVVEDKNLYSRHMKATPNQPGQKVQLPRPIPVANIALVCPNCKKTIRVAFDSTQKPKLRVCPKCKQVIKSQSPSKK